MDNKQARYLHRMLDRLAEGKNLSPEEIALLRKELPELPIQKTLEDIAWDMDFAWCETSGNDWKEELFGDLETWLSEQHNQLRAHLEGVKIQAHPELPAGMRLAKHEEYGRCVVSPGRNHFGQCMIFVLDSDREEGSDWHYEPSTSLTFLDTSPTARAHPEFLETEADYQKAPEGTIVASSGRFPWVKGAASGWACSSSTNSDFAMSKIGRRNVLRWGWGNE